MNVYMCTYTLIYLFIEVFVFSYLYTVIGISWVPAGPPGGKAYLDLSLLSLRQIYRYLKPFICTDITCRDIGLQIDCAAEFNV